MVESFHAERFNIAKLPRQSGKSTIVTAYLLWYVLFNDNVNVAILANKAWPLQERCWDAYSYLTRIFLNGCNKVYWGGTRDPWSWRTGVRFWLQVLVLLLFAVCPLTLFFWTNSRSFRITLLISFSVLCIQQFHLVRILKLLLYQPHMG